ncbi:hypothetical protein PoB_006711000 [Plakobranchus ocellatus]|uniref:Uncharacterized protein n=1 Tax=Plakobranchus ocellatus TaxID=259542 RepID=A0AAV4D9G1_9GAST|nr:hypothetical protein PoB_006711000 [Plakobranchus ocellatus]
MTLSFLEERGTTTYPEYGENPIIEPHTDPPEAIQGDKATEADKSESKTESTATLDILNTRPSRDIHLEEDKFLVEMIDQYVKESIERG